LATGFALNSSSVLAGEWSQSISSPATIEYDSNLPLSATAKQAVTRLIVTPVYGVVAGFGNDELQVGLGMHVERSANQRVSMNREDPNLRFGWRRLTEAGELGLTTTYDQVSSRAAELQNTGSITSDSTQKTKAVKGLWRSAVTDFSTLTADADYKTVSYDTGTQTNFSNFSAGIKWDYAWSERIDPFLHFSVSRYSPDKITATAIKSDYYTATIGVKVKASSHLEWALQGGPNVISAPTSNTGWQGSFDLKYLGNRYDLAFNTGRSVSTSGSGGLVASDRVAGTFNFAIDERSAVGFSGTWQNNKGNNPNTMQQLGAWASHEVSSFVQARIYYQHKVRHQDGQSDVSGNVVGVTLVYSPSSF
jgi:hypothetical protein